MTASHLADESALVRVGRPEVERRLGPLLLAGKLATCGIVDLEMLFSARDHRDLREIRAVRRASYQLVAMRQEDFDRAIDVMESLSKRGQHRGVTLPDLLIAAAAERESLIVLHYDADYDRIARVTGQATEWVAPRGTLD